MAVDSPWFSQDCHELHRDWLFFMPPGARIAWIMLKDHVKSRALSQKQPNKAPRLSHQMAAHHWNVTADDVRTMEDGAIAAGAITIDGNSWIVTDRLIFQSERTAQRYGGVCPTNADKPTHEPTPCHVTETLTETETLKIDAKASVPPKPPKLVEVATPEPATTTEREANHAYDPVHRVLLQVHSVLEWSEPNPADIQTQLKADSPVPTLISGYGEDGAIEMFLFANDTWAPKRPTWAAVCRNRNQLWDEMNRRHVDTGRRRASGGLRNVADEFLTAIKQVTNGQPDLRRETKPGIGNDEFDSQRLELGPRQFGASVDVGHSRAG